MAHNTRQKPPKSKRQQDLDRWGLRATTFYMPTAMHREFRSFLKGRRLEISETCRKAVKLLMALEKEEVSS